LFEKRTFEIVANIISKLKGSEELENPYFKYKALSNHIILFKRIFRQ
jgi:hypothetical protein